MTKISIYVNCEGVTVRPDRPNRITIDADGIELEELLDYIDEKDEIFQHIIESNPEDHISSNELASFLDRFDAEMVVEYMKSRGWELNNESDS